MSLSNTWKGKLEEASFFAVWKSAQAVCYNKKQKSEEISQCQRCHKNKEKKIAPLKIILFFSLLTAILSSKILGMVFFPSFFLYFFSLDCCRILNFFEFFHNFWLYLLSTLRICHLKSMKLQSVKNLFVLFCEHMLFEVTHFFVYHLINL